MTQSDDIAVFRAELDAFLTSAADATTWHVERVIKRSDFESTELVRGEPQTGRLGRYVRKQLDLGSGAGGAYLALWNAQRRGSCPGCVPRLVECTRCDDELTVVMEYVEGCTVDFLVASLGAGAHVASLVMPSLCDAVAALHEAFDPPLIHRDLKPSNVLMRAGAPVIIDFGSARQWRADADADTTHFLTRRYAPPEQFGFGQTDARSDVYALGKLFYFCLTGENPPNVCDAQACERAGIPQSAREVICRACAFDPDARYQCARDLKGAIEDALRPVDADSVPAMEEHRAPHLAPWIALLWNGLVFGAFFVIALGSMVAIFSLNAHDAQFPLWYRAVEYIGVGVVSAGAVCYLLFKKESVYKRVPALAHLGKRRELMGTLAVFVLGIAVPLIVGWATGLM